MNNVDLLKDICEDIYEITRIKTVIYDGEMNNIYAHPLSMGEFCSEIRKHKELAKKCIECDKKGFSECRKKGDMYIYKCHMGLTEAVTPIYDREDIIGFILFGQMLEENSKEEIIRKIKSLKLNNEEKLIDALNKKEYTDKKIISASARLISMCASYVHFKKVLNLRRESLSLHISRYISDNIKDVTIKKITSEFAISSGTLYNISKEAFNMGISEYIRKQRIKKAIRLLSEEDIPIYRVADEVGIMDANYLTKLIKKETGKTPKEIKKENL